MQNSTPSRLVISQSEDNWTVLLEEKGTWGHPNPTGAKNIELGLRTPIEPSMATTNPMTWVALCITFLPPSSFITLFNPSRHFHILLIYFYYVRTQFFNHTYYPIFFLPLSGLCFLCLVQFISWRRPTWSKRTDCMCLPATIKVD